MAFDLGSALSGAVGGFVASGFNPLGALAGGAIGGFTGGVAEQEAEDKTEATKRATKTQNAAYDAIEQSSNPV